MGSNVEDGQRRRSGHKLRARDLLSDQESACSRSKLESTYVEKEIIAYRPAEESELIWSLSQNRSLEK